MLISEEHQKQLEEYARKVLSCLRRWLVEDDRPFPAGSDYKVTIEDIRLERMNTGNDVIIIFREASRPECLFGFGTFAVEPSEPHGPAGLDPEGWASVILANFEEELCAVNYGLPDDCDPEDITWI